MCCLCSGIGFVRLLADYNQVDGNSFLEADLQNNFMGITGVRVNRDRGRYLNNINSSTLTVKLCCFLKGLYYSSRNSFFLFR